MRKIILWLLVGTIFAAALIVGPNFLWLSRSSAIVHNRGSETLVIRLRVMDRPERIAELELAPGASQFLWLEIKGEASLIVEVKDDAAWRDHCTEYVENGMYRVEVTARSRTEASCHVDLPLLDRLLIRDLLF